MFFFFFFLTSRQVGKHARTGNNPMLARVPYSASIARSTPSDPDTFCLPFYGRHVNDPPRDIKGIARRKPGEGAPSDIRGQHRSKHIAVYAYRRRGAHRLKGSRCARLKYGDSRQRLVRHTAITLAQILYSPLHS